jgi:UDP-glucose 4-epimerase
MNFLITGAAGFLGAALANRLAWEGHQVRGLDDLSTGDPNALHPEVLFTRGDVNDRPKLWTLLQDDGLRLPPGCARLGARIGALSA